MSHIAFSFEAFGISVHVRWGFLAMLGFVTYVTGGIVFPLILALCVLGHELSHALVARHFGYHLGDITFFLLGGAAGIEERKFADKENLAIAIAGPLFNFVIVGLVFTLRFLVGDISAILSSILDTTIFVNTVIGVFNMIPAYPMDGGRILRSGLGLLGLKRKTVTDVTHFVGLLFAGFFAVFGIYSMSFMLPLLGLFIGFYIIRERRNS